MASNKIHLLRQSAMEAGTPGKYYISPSEKLMSKASEWSVVEHEDYVETRFSMAFVKDCENKDDDFSYIVNTDFLNLKEINGEIKDVFQ
ncbi:hypothetical protein MKX01_000052 [Papaver californicum]|nr:hypothetical protein MKX01_000052 [Papaver californicum]